MTHMVRRKCSPNKNNPNILVEYIVREWFSGLRFKLLSDIARDVLI